MRIRNTGRAGQAAVAACAAGVGLGLLLGLAACQTERTRTDAYATPVMDWDGMENASRAGDVTFGAQPDENALERYSVEGGRMVVDLRTHQGLDVASYDERARVEALGMDYVHIPMSSDTFSAADVDRFAEALESADGPVLVHCGSSNRVGGMWAAYLARHRGWDLEEAMEAGRAAGMRSESVEAAARRVAAE